MPIDGTLSYIYASSYKVFGLMWSLSLIGNLYVSGIQQAL